MKLIYTSGFSKDERLEVKPVILSNIVQSFRLIHDIMNEMDLPFENPENDVSTLACAPSAPCPRRVSPPVWRLPAGCQL
jgi:hypothetical protein